MTTKGVKFSTGVDKQLQDTSPFLLDVKGSQLQVLSSVFVSALPVRPCQSGCVGRR